MVKAIGVKERVAAYLIEGLSSNQICQAGKCCAVSIIATENPSEEKTSGFRTTNLQSVRTIWLIVRQSRWRCSSLRYIPQPPWNTVRLIVMLSVQAVIGQ
ncbi:hypothetical protein SH449x_000225 [Pirellulaceae bacterium SH449]